MRAVTIDPDGKNEYQFVERPEPVPGPGEVALSMRAASLNFRDVIVRTHPTTAYPGADARGKIALSDGVGVLTRMGDGVTGLTPGARYMPSFFPHWLEGHAEPAKLGISLGAAVDGVLAETIVVPAASLVRVPDHLSDEEAAALPCAAVTAWTGLVTYGKAQAGQTVLVQGTGGVSIFVLQFAKLLGLRTIVTSSSDEKLARARALGADETINYRTTPDWASAARELTNGLGVDLLIDVGGEATLQQSLDAMAVGGNLSLVGVLTGFGGQIDTLAIRRKVLHIHAIFVESRAVLQELTDFIAKTGMHPVIDHTFEMREANAALGALVTAQHFGKLAIRVQG